MKSKPSGKKRSYAYVVKGTDGSYISGLYWWKETLLEKWTALPTGCSIVEVKITEQPKKRGAKRG